MKLLVMVECNSPVGVRCFENPQVAFTITSRAGTGGAICP